MRAVMIAVVIAALLPGSAFAQKALGASFHGSEEELDVALEPTFRWGRYGVQLRYPITLIYDDPYNGGVENGSFLGLVTTMPFFVISLFLHTPEPRPKTLALMAGYAIATALLNSQHHLVLHERPGEDGGRWQAASVFVGPQTEIYHFRDVQWGRYSITGGFSYGFWREGSTGGMIGDKGFGLEVGVEFPWDIVGGDWTDQDPLLFAGVVFWGE